MGEHLAHGGTYMEPFLGGGAVYFRLRPARALLGDINAELIATYTTVRDHAASLIPRLKSLPVDAETYYRVRGKRPRSEIGRAVRFLYLNRTAFGGVYRLNQAGEFNVPFGGRSPSVLWEQGLLMRAASALSGARLVHADFEVLLRRAQSGDVVFCDPTYTVAHDNNGFVRYNERNFSWLDQIRLAKAAKEARNRGAMVLVSNAHHESVRALYKGEERLVLHRNSRVSRAASGRRSVSEYLFVLQ